MKQEREVINKWWNMKPKYEKDYLMGKYGYEINSPYFLTTIELKSIYLKEQESKEVSNVSDKLDWTKCTCGKSKDEYCDLTCEKEEPVSVSVEERINRFQRQMEAYDNEHANGGDIQNMKESYYYKGRRDEAEASKSMAIALQKFVSKCEAATLYESYETLQQLIEEAKEALKQAGL